MTHEYVFSLVLKRPRTIRSVYNSHWKYVTQAHVTQMGSGAWDPRPSLPFIASLQVSRSPAQAVTTKAAHSTPADGDHRAIPSSKSSNVSEVLLQSPPSCRCLPCCALPFVSLCGSRQNALRRQCRCPIRPVRTKNTLPNIFADVNHHALRAQQNPSPLTPACNSVSATRRVHLPTLSELTPLEKSSTHVAVLERTVHSARTCFFLLLFFESA